MPFSAIGVVFSPRRLRSNISDFTNEFEDPWNAPPLLACYNSQEPVAFRAGVDGFRDMIWGRTGIHQLTALLVLVILMAASGLPHWHPVPLEKPDKSDILLDETPSEEGVLLSASDADLFECAACVLQRILTHARTQGALAALPPVLQAEVEATSEVAVSKPPLRYADPRGPPRS